MPGSTDIEIRTALHHKKLKQSHACQNTLVIDELGLAHAKARIDVAVINGCVHGFEIKSEMDSLSRLPIQLNLYRDCLQKLTIVCAEKHVQQVQEISPRWCGILKAKKGPRGGINFEAIRISRPNPDVRADQLAHLLWRREVVELLIQLNAPRRVLKRPRTELYVCLAELMTIDQIIVHIRQFMAMRGDWRRLPVHA